MGVHSRVINDSPKLEIQMAEWTNKMWYFYAMDYLEIKWNYVLIHATTWTNIENIMSEKSHILHDCLYKVFRITNIERKSISVVTKSRGIGAEMWGDSKWVWSFFYAMMKIL